MEYNCNYKPGYNSDYMGEKGRVAERKFLKAILLLIMSWQS